MTLTVVAACLASGSAFSQWQWLDKGGRKVFSDQPPPIDIPVRNILKQPGKSASASAGVAPADASPLPATASSSPAGATGATPVLSQNDKDLQARKAKAEADAAAKIKADELAKAQVKLTECDSARKKQALMDSGVRVSITGANGEREILDDAARASEQKKIRTVIEQNCK